MILSLITAVGQQRGRQETACIRAKDDEQMGCGQKPLADETSLGLL
jgi:hypothetical protein